MAKSKKFFSTSTEPVDPCASCTLKDTCKSPKLPFIGKGKKNVLIIGSRPSSEEDLKGGLGRGSEFNFRDRDLLLTGPVVADMAANFDAFWDSKRSVPAEQLGDVARYLREHGPPPAPHHVFHNPARVRALLAEVADEAALRTLAAAVLGGRVSSS